ncbi:MAG: inositol monophosphatase family protein [Candidatus Roizmanbacteria bacterium]
MNENVRRLHESHPLSCCVRPATLLYSTFSHPHNLNRRLARGVATKNDGSSVTPLDYLMQQIYVREILKQHPSAHIIGEEKVYQQHTGDSSISGTLFSEGRTYFIDPVDGTSNLGTDHGNINTQVGMCDDGLFAGGLIAQPGVPSNGMFVGEVNNGAYRLDEKGTILECLHPPPTISTMEEAKCYVRWPNVKNIPARAKALGYTVCEALYPVLKRRTLSVSDSLNESDALKRLIYGKQTNLVLLPPVEPHHGPQAWDIAPGLGLVASLGATMRTWRGDSLTIDNIYQGAIVSFSPGIVDKLVEMTEPLCR